MPHLTHLNNDCVVVTTLDQQSAAAKSRKKRGKWRPVIPPIWKKFLDSLSKKKKAEVRVWALPRLRRVILDMYARQPNPNNKAHCSHAWLHHHRVCQVH